MWSMVTNYLELFRIPLSFLPEPIQQYLSVVVGCFSLFVIGRMLKWVFDALPAI